MTEVSEIPTKKMIMSGSAYEPLGDIGKTLTRRRYEIGIKYEAFDKKDKKWTEVIRRTSRYSLHEALFEERKQLAEFGERKNLRLVTNWMTVIII